MLQKRSASTADRKMEILLSHQLVVHLFLRIAKQKGPPWRHGTMLATLWRVWKET